MARQIERGNLSATQFHRHSVSKFVYGNPKNQQLRGGASSLKE